MKSIDIVSKIVAREGEAKASPSKGIQSINLSDYLLKSVWDKVFEVRTDSQGAEYIFGKLPMVTQYGITMFSGEGVKVPSLASGLPFDGRTIWYNPDTQQIEVIGGTGGGSGEGVSNFWDLSGIPSWITNSKPKYTYSEIEGTPDLTKYALVSQIPSLSGYATESWVTKQNYATKATTLSGYGITDAYTKTNVDDLLKAYVTLGGTQTITGEKNFTGGLKVNGSPIYYDSTKKYWKLEGDLLVTGGVTMYGNDSSFTPSTIMDAIVVDGTTISKSGGVLKVIGGTGGGVADSVAWSNITGKPNFASVATSGKYDDLIGKPTLLSSFTDDVVSGKYLPLSGGTLTGNILLGGTTTNKIGTNIVDTTGWQEFTHQNSHGYIAIGPFNDSVAHIYTDRPSFYFNKELYVNNAKVWNAGNDGSGSTLDADLLDGKHLNDILASNVASATKLNDNSSFTAWGQTFFTNGKPQSVNGGLSGATTINSVLKPYKGNGTAAYLHMTNIDANPWAYVHLFVSNENLGNTSRALILQNGYGNVGIGLSDPQYKLDVGGSARFSSICTINSSNTTAPILNIKSEAGDVDYIHLFISSNSGTHTNIRPLVFQNGYGNVGIGIANPSYKLDVNGSLGVSGNIHIGANTIFGKNDANALSCTSNHVVVGYGIAENGWPTYIDGNVIYFRYGTSHTNGMYLNSSGNVGIDTTSPSYKLDVNGTIRFASKTLWGQSFDGTGNVNGNMTGVGIVNSFLNIKQDGSSVSHLFLTNPVSNVDYGHIYVSNYDNSRKDRPLSLQNGFGNVGIGLPNPSAKLHVSGDILATGGITMYSMRVLKNVVDERGLSLNELSTIKPTRYTWKDGRDNRLHFGGIADDIQQVLPEVVYSTSDGILTMDYGNAAFAVASSLIQPVVNHEKRIAILEEENKQLRQEVERLKSA